jgi:xanthine dehydrogenase molybdenum-binding subunit
MVIEARPARVMPQRAVGRRVAKRDALEKVTGAARYTGDLTLPGMVYARFLRSPYAHARVTRVDTSQAEALPGVLAVLTHLNTPKTKYSDTKTDQLNLLPHPSNLDQVLFDAKVRYAGEPVAAVAALDRETVERALELIEVEYEQLPAVYEPLAALAPDAPSIHDHVHHNTAGYLPLSFGDVESGFAQADIVVQETFTTSRQKHIQMEPTACLAHWDESGKISVWTPTQTPHLNKQKLASLFEVPQNRVRVVNPHIGGAFGATLGFTLEPHAVALSRAAGRPVLLEVSREEMFASNSSRHPMVITLEAGFTREGQPTAIKVRLVANTGAYATEGPDVVGATTGHFFRLYPCFNIAFEGITVYTNAPPAGGFRGYGGPQAVFAMESVIDVAAERLGLDPLEMRRRISNTKGGFDGVMQRPILSCGLDECLDRGAAAVGWSDRRRHARPAEPASQPRRGMGMASTMWVSGTACLVSTLDSSAAMITMNEDGSATILCAACDMGTGARTALSQVVADELGLPVERVHIGAVDTELTPFESGAHASRTLYAAGNASRLAAADVREQVLAFAAAQLEVDLADLEIDDGHIRVAGVPEKSTTVQAVAHAAYLKGIQFMGRANSPQTNEPPFGAQFAEVEVDTETGIVRVLKLVAAHDVGKAINPTIVEGQLEGALAQGLGFAFMEHLPLDPDTGSPTMATLSDYRIPTAEWMPELELIVVEDPGPTGPFGAKGCGEMGLAPTAAAIANAIFDATGVRMRDLPMTPERVLAALRGSA